MNQYLALALQQNNDRILNFYECGPAQRAALEEYAELVVKLCIDKIETYRIPVGNSASGELACEWTYDALKEIRDDIVETFGIRK